MRTFMMQISRTTRPGEILTPIVFANRTFVDSNSSQNHARQRWIEVAQGSTKRSAPDAASSHSTIVS